MKKQDLAELERQLLGKVVARLYLEVLPQSGAEGMRARTRETFGLIDKQFGLQRPSFQDLRQWAEKAAKGDIEIRGEMVWRVLEEITVFAQGEFGTQYEHELRNRIESLLTAALEDKTLSEAEYQQLFTTIINDCLGLGPLESLLADSTVVEVMVDGPKKVYLERHGKFEDTPHRFRDEGHLMSIIHRIVALTGRQLNESHPMVDARLSDGSRVNIVIPPISLTGPAMTIRKFPKQELTLEDLLRFGTISEEIATFLHACVQSHLNILVSGSTASGKLTFLNILARMIPDDERIIVVEEAAELYDLSETKKYVVSLESRPPNAEGVGEVNTRDLVIIALRMRPDRIVLGETRGAEAPELVQAMNTGHDGCMTTIYAFAPRDALQRLETMMMQHPNTALNLPVLAIREQIATAIDVIVQLERLRDGSRKVTSVSEVLGLEGNVIVMQDIFQYKRTGWEDERFVGHHPPTGLIPRFLPRFQAYGAEVPLSLFTPK